MSFETVKSKFKLWFGKTYEEVRAETSKQAHTVATVTYGTVFWIALAAYVLGLLTHLL